MVDEAEVAMARAVAFIGSSQSRGQWVMRVSVTSAATTLQDADKTVESVLRAWARARETSALSMV